MVLWSFSDFTEAAIEGFKLIFFLDDSKRFCYEFYRETQSRQKRGFFRNNWEVQSCLVFDFIEAPKMKFVSFKKVFERFKEVCCYIF